MRIATGEIEEGGEPETKAARAAAPMEKELSGLPVFNRPEHIVLPKIAAC